MADPLAVPGLTVAGCQARQQRLRPYLERLQLDAALIGDRRHVHYFTGYWCREVFAAAVLIERGGPTRLVVPLPTAEPVAADEIRTYPSNHLGTLVDDHLEGVLQPLQVRLAQCQRIG